MMAYELRSGDCFIWHGVEVCSADDYVCNEDNILFIVLPEVYENNYLYTHANSGYENIMPEEELQFTRRIKRNANECK